MFGIYAMAGKALIREDGSNVAVELHVLSVTGSRDEQERENREGGWAEDARNPFEHECRLQGPACIQTPTVFFLIQCTLEPWSSWRRTQEACKIRRLPSLGGPT